MRMRGQECSRMLVVAITLAMLTACSGPAHAKLLAPGHRAAASRGLLQGAGAAGDKHPWSLFLSESWLFYEAQQSGYLPSWNRVTRSKGYWRDNAHLQDGFGPSAPNVSLAGGFYEAGSHLKCGLQFGHSMSVLALAMLLHEPAFRQTNEWDNGAGNLAYAGEYLVRAHLTSSPDPLVNEFVAQVGDDKENDLWQRPEQATNARPVFTTRQSQSGAPPAASDQLGINGGAMAAIAMVLLKDGAYQNSSMATDLIARARNMLAAGGAQLGMWKLPVGKELYPSSSYWDDLAWGNMALCWYDMLAVPATLPDSCNAALSAWAQAYTGLGANAQWSWDQNLMLSALVISKLGDKLTALDARWIDAVSQAGAHVNTFFAYWTNTNQRCPGGDFQLCYTAGGLAYLAHWAPLRYTGLATCATVTSAQHTPGISAVQRRQQRCWARGQLSYMAGDNPLKIVYIAGTYQPTPNHTIVNQIHHRSSSCNKDYSIPCNDTARKANKPNPNILIGALVGGPAADDSYVNRRIDYIQSEVALDYNAGFTCTVAGLTEVTTNLAANGCNWDTYCVGGCDSAAEDPACPRRERLPGYTVQACDVQPPPANLPPGVYDFTQLASLYYAKAAQAPAGSP